jgi:hypothetical protein
MGIGKNVTVILTPYEGVSKSFWSGHLERELQMVQLSATRCSYIAILWVSLVSFAAITLCVASQRVFIVVSVYFVLTQSGNFLIHRRIKETRWLLTCRHSLTQWRTLTVVSRPPIQVELATLATAERHRTNVRIVQLPDNRCTKPVF